MQGKPLTRVLIGLCVLLVVAMVVPVLSGCGGDGAGDKVYKIGISQIITHAALDATREGVIEGMAYAPRRYIQEASRRSWTAIWTPSTSRKQSSR